MHPPGSCNHPLRGLIEFCGPREFGSTLEPDAIEADPSAEFTSGRRDGRCRAGDRRWDMEDRGGFEFLCEALIQSIVERVERMGGGRFEGANLRT